MCDLCCFFSFRLGTATLIAPIILQIMKEVSVTSMFTACLVPSFFPLLCCTAGNAISMHICSCSVQLVLRLASYDDTLSPVDSWLLPCFYAVQVVVCGSARLKLQLAGKRPWAITFVHTRWERSLPICAPFDIAYLNLSLRHGHQSCVSIGILAVAFE